MHERYTPDIPIFHSTYDLYRLIDALTESVPKSKRYTLWQKVELCVLDILILIIEVSHRKKKDHSGLLQEISVQHDLLKVFLRLSKETRCIDLKGYLKIERKLSEIGKMLGGWIKFAGPQFPEDL